MFLHGPGFGSASQPAADWTRRTIRKDGICPASEGYEAFKWQSLLILREERRRSLCAHAYVAALI